MWEGTLCFLVEWILCKRLPQKGGVPQRASLFLLRLYRREGGDLGGEKNHSDPLPILWHKITYRGSWGGKEGKALSTHFSASSLTLVWREFGNKINPNFPSSLYGQFDDTNLLLLLCELGRSQITPRDPQLGLTLVSPPQKIAKFAEK